MISRQWLQSRYRLLAALHDLALVPIAWLTAFWLRFNLDGIPQDALLLALYSLPIVLGIQGFAFWTFGLYRGIWQFASLPDLFRIFKAVMFGTFGTLTLLFLITRLQGVPRSVFPIYAMLLTLCLGGSRFLVRALKDYKREYNKEAEGNTKKKILIVGAGKAGESLLRDLLRDKDTHYVPLAFVDDRSTIQGQDIHGVRVMGRCCDIARLVKEHEISVIIIAMPSARAQEMRLIMEYCKETAAQIRTLPSRKDLVEGRVSVDLLREVSLEDLLGRDPVQLDWHSITESIVNQVVLVTGGGGSIGSELCRQIAKLNPAKLLVIERSEFNLFTLQQEFQKQFPNLSVIYHLLDVNDRFMIHEVLSRHKPQIIFHAAAYKHVPMLESQPREAIANNVLGTQTMAELAILNKVDKFVLVSSDKAVNPANIMGASKRISEMVCHYYHGKGVTRFITVRFGNVLGSAGSVVPIFKHQIDCGGPVTVTHPDITRFFMTIPEACQLILQALVLGQGGEIFVLDMGEPIKIKYLAEQMIRLSGKRLGEDIFIEYTGLRMGEKMFEELFHPEENLESTEHPKILRAQARFFHDFKFLGLLDGLKHTVTQCDEQKMLKFVRDFVPELKQEFQQQID